MSLNEFFLGAESAHGLVDDGGVQFELVHRMRTVVDCARGGSGTWGIRGG